MVLQDILIVNIAAPYCVAGSFLGEADESLTAIYFLLRREYLRFKKRFHALKNSGRFPFQFISYLLKYDRTLISSYSMQDLVLELWY
jgi:hypothetical protein